MSEKPPEAVLLRKQALYEVPLFAGVSELAFGLLAEQASDSCFHAGQAIVRQGDPGTKLFVIVSGEVRVLRQSRHADLEVARMKTGDFFGEMCILEELPRSATVEAVTDTRILLLSYAAFERLFELMPADHHTILANMARSLSARLRELGDFFALRS